MRNPTAPTAPTARRIRLATITTIALVAVTALTACSSTDEAGTAPAARPSTQEIAALFDQWNTALKGDPRVWPTCTPTTGYCCRP
ncbi:hypothetical protein EV643_106229 [Kribbella sp. VKM Ac-2527]|uniref:Uncharacterized protein n=1 Tax=Kribbella caucasensis TaxID=2512215 RepID=A0A4R6KHW6_9ACTN|nr:hypothetical protein EV643_106229 [Kribbella sp. VKM Ac-2527]